jgi:hypothetical protein
MSLEMDATDHSTRRRRRRRKLSPDSLDQGVGERTMEVGIRASYKFMSYWLLLLRLLTLSLPLSHFGENLL